MDNIVWSDNRAQFARLLSEISAVADLTPEQIDAVAESMNLERPELFELFIRAENEFEEMKVNGAEPLVSVLLNEFTDDGELADSHSMELKQSTVSDIIDHAAQLAIIVRGMARNRCTINDFDQAYAELESALVTADVIAEDDYPMPVIGLLNVPSA